MAQHALLIWGLPIAAQFNGDGFQDKE